MSNIVVYVLLLGSAISEEYPTIVFPLSNPPRESTIFTKLVVKTTNTTLTKCTIFNKIPPIVTGNGTFDMDLSNQSGIVAISVQNPAEVAIAVQELKRSYYYTIAPSVNLGNEYMLVSSSAISDKYVCRISAASPQQVVVNIRIPVSLQQQFNFSGSGQCYEKSFCSLQSRQFIQIESGVPLYQTAVDSQNNMLVVFCKDSSMFQVLPKTNCGKYFQSSCPVFNITHVNNCSLKVNVVLSKRQSVKVNDKEYIIDRHFLEIPLEKEMKWTLQAEHDVCVLFVDTYYDGSGNTAVRTRMLSSIPVLPTLTTPDARSSSGITSPTVTTSISSSHPTTLEAFGVSTQQSKGPLTANTTSRTWVSNKAARVTLSRTLVSSTAAHATLSRTLVSSTAAHTTLSRTLVSSTAAHATLSRTLVSSTAAHSTLSRTLVSSTAAHSTLPRTLVSSTAAHATLSRTLVSSTAAHSTLSRTLVSSTAAHATLSRTLVSSTAARATSSNIWTQFTETPDKLRTTYSIFGHHNRTNITSKDICICICKNLSQAVNNSVYVSSYHKIHELITELKVNKSQLSSRVRSKSCASDDRPSAQSLGYVGGVVIALVLTAIASLDLINLCQKCKLKRKLRMKERKTMCQDRWVSKRVSKS